MNQISTLWIAMLLAILPNSAKAFRSNSSPLSSTFSRRSAFYPNKRASPPQSSWFRLQHSGTIKEEETSPTTTSSTTTMYTIDCPPTSPETLKEVVTKHCQTLNQFLANKPIAAHTLEAFQKCQALIPPNATLILDSGCGTGRSTRRLASLYGHKEEKVDDHWVLGIDRSLVRLERNQGFRRQQQQRQPEEQSDDEVVWQDNQDNTSISSSSASSSALWIRAELVGFWRLLLQHQDQHGWIIRSHYLLYPNPYPKLKRFKSRWYGHPSFPLILQVGGDKIVVRSNWETYLQEFAQAILIADQVWSEEGTTTINYAKPYVESAKRGPVQRQPVEVNEGWSNFERKMDQAGEPTFELVLERSSP